MIELELRALIISLFFLFSITIGILLIWGISSSASSDKEDGGGFYRLRTLIEEDLVVTHRKQVEETIDIVREEMNLLVEADQPGSKLDDYISKLNSLLSRKAAGIVNMQARLARFQGHLNEYNVLLSSPGP
ncbi:hypothetical protein COCNU_14G002160 [Cocos nucifera]|uniref:Uncharacterized protein n=1 Tax=Cocos nucifera TaxID=13894 RepID=A0A8K0IUK4_COCNU|nr:hypothetical protein COCNU_14G002160 [Cocos nucifera]